MPAFSTALKRFPERDAEFLAEEIVDERITGTGADHQYGQDGRRQHQRTGLGVFQERRHEKENVKRRVTNQKDDDDGQQHGGGSAFALRRRCVFSSSRRRRVAFWFRVVYGAQVTDARQNFLALGQTRHDTHVRNGDHAHGHGEQQYECGDAVRLPAEFPALVGPVFPAHSVIREQSRGGLWGGDGEGQEPRDGNEGCCAPGCVLRARLEGRDDRVVPAECTMPSLVESSLARSSLGSF